MSDESDFPIEEQDLEPEQWFVIERIARLIRIYYEENCTGGNLHIVLDDDNLEDGHIEYCIRQASAEQDHLGVCIGNMLLALPTEYQRMQAISVPRDME